MLASDAVKSHRIQVSIEGGIVTLSVKVRKLLAEDIAVGLAESIRGVILRLVEDDALTGFFFAVKLWSVLSGRFA